MPVTTTKPRVRASSIPWLMAIWERIKDNEHAWHDYTLRQVPADVFDGWCIPSELSDLVRRRILQVIPVPKRDQTSVSPVTWYFTDRGMAIMRAWKAGRPADLPEVHPGNCCPNCGTPLEDLPCTP